DFPKLRQYFHRKPYARKVMETVFEKGYEVIIATTPLLPETAIIQRLEWAGVADFPYKLITTLENTRASKSKLLYYKLILETIDHPAKACMMIGDEDKDMAAANLGIYTFLVQSSNTDLNPSTPEPNYRGTLVDLKSLILES
ncbi:MAG: HAD family hydrolase, partial [Promethearchaeota archaeon]